MSEKTTDNVVVTKTKVIFIIESYDKSESYLSNTFDIGSESWCLILKPTILSDCPVIKLRFPHNSKVKTNCEVFVIENGIKKFFIETDQTIDKTYQFKNFKSTVDEELPQEWLTIGAIITKVSKTYDFIGNVVDIRNTFNDEELNDFKIICGQKELFVSKLILMSLSEVFKTMFLIDMKEQNTNQLVVEDIDEKVMQEFLNYLYFGDLGQLDNFKEELLYVSDKYEVLNLKTICSKLLFVEINPKNAIKLLLTFDKYNCNEVREQTIDFIANNLKKIKNQTMNEWLELIKSDYLMADKITDRMIQLIDTYNSNSNKSDFHN